ncbi:MULTISPECIES: hypothetical protein [Halobacteriales]|uniref:Uncharacterized protein n=2 Tax=Halobacteriales TaxID=2235 RepID=A0A1I0QZ79_9EURY|nr:hypothetical protein [Natrinema salifodinae]SEW32913.1 hypothetical protein SAMN05216285_4169 [Natrinema salifodinae]
MATHDHHETLEPTETDRDRGRALVPRLREAGLTLFDAATTSLDLRPSPSVCPDGDWLCDEDLPLRKTWSRRGQADHIQLTSGGLSGLWTVTHQLPDGRSEVIASDLEREAAYARAEQYMADLDSVARANRTGRAAE